MSSRCPWCIDTTEEAWSADLCEGHEAEYEGLTVDELRRMHAEQSAELAEL